MLKQAVLLTLFFIMIAVFWPSMALSQEDNEDLELLFDDLDLDWLIDGEEGDTEEVTEETGEEEIIDLFDLEDVTIEDAGIDIEGDETELEAGFEEELMFEEVDVEDLEFEEDFLDEEFRGQISTYGFLLNFVSELFGFISADKEIFDTDVYPLQVEAFNEKGSYDFSEYAENDLLTRQVFAEFVFSVLQKKRRDLRSKDYPDKEQWAVTNGYIQRPEEGDELLDIPGLIDDDELQLEDLIPKEEEGEDVMWEEEGEPEDIEAIKGRIPKLIQPDKITGSVDVESAVTIKFVPVHPAIGKYKILKKDDIAGTYTEIGVISAEDEGFTDKESLASHKIGREINQYQVSRTDEDFILTVTYQEPSGITTEKSIIYKIVPDMESITARKVIKKEEFILPDFLSAKVDYAGNIFLRWVEEDETPGTCKIYGKKEGDAEFKVIREGVEMAEFSDNLAREDVKMAGVNEYQISRNMDDFMITISYNDADGMPNEIKYYYKVLKERDLPEMDEDTFIQDIYVTRGEVIDAFDKIEGEEMPRLRQALIEIPVFSPVFIMPASPI